MVVAANKMDLPGAAENLQKLKAALSSVYEIYPVSAVTGAGLEPLVYRLAGLIATLPEEAEEELAPESPVLHRYEPQFRVTRENGIFIVAGKDIERRIAMTNMDNEESVERLQRLLQRSGIVAALVGAGVKEGDTVQIGPIIFEYAE